MALSLGDLGSRVWMAAIAVVVIFGCALALLHRMGSVEMRPLTKSLEDVPRQIEGYTGENTTLDNRVAQEVDAKDAISRIYRNSSGQWISIHVAAWDSLGQPTLPHLPMHCYPGTGAIIVGQRPVTVPAEIPFQASLLTIDRDGQRSLVLFWYAWDERVCTSRSQACLVRLRLATYSQWPPLVKVLMETAVGQSEDDAQQRLLSFAVKIREATQSL